MESDIDFLTRQVIEIDSKSSEIAPSQRRLQRPPDFTGGRLNHFSQIFLRHGLPGALLGALCLLSPDLRTILVHALSDFVAAPGRYLLWGTIILGALVGHTWIIDRRVDPAAFGWMLYLLALSVWEEWVFRLAIPYLGQAQGLDVRVSVLLSNLAFGAMHYFTLRWKWYWCVAAFVGGMALSRQMNLHFDLALVVALHWVATYINTPRPPGRAARRETGVQ